MQVSLQSWARPWQYPPRRARLGCALPVVGVLVQPERVRESEQLSEQTEAETLGYLPTLSDPSLLPLRDESWLLREVHGDGSRRGRRRRSALVLVRFAELEPRLWVSEKSRTRSCQRAWANLRVGHGDQTVPVTGWVYLFNDKASRWREPGGSDELSDVSVSSRAAVFFFYISFWQRVERVAETHERLH